MALKQFLKENRGYLVALALIGAFCYCFNLRGPLFWDDADWILNNISVHALTWANIKFIFTHDALAAIGQVSNYYRPLMFVTFIFNWITSGSNPVPFHLINNAIHIFDGFLVFYLLVRWLKSSRAAFLAALLFVIHPLQTEAFAYVSGRADPMSVCFVLVAVICYLHGKKRWSYGLAVLAILTRETAVLLPGYFGVALMAFEYRGTLWERFKPAFLAALPFAAISAVYGVLRLTVLNFQNTLNFYQQQNIYSEHVTYRVYTFLHALLVYLRLSFWPTGLHMDRDIPVSIHIWNGWSWLGGLAILSLLAWLVWLYKKGNRQTFAIWFFGLGIFFINLAPTSGIIPINARIYEHWLYFSLVGLFAIVGWYLDRIWSWIERRQPGFQSAWVIVLVVYILFLGIQCIRRNLVWSDPQAMYLDILHYEPNDVRVLNNLGNWDSDHGQLTDAAALYEQAIALDPTQPAPYYNLGNILRDEGQLEQTEKLYKKAIEASPSFHYAYENLAVLYANQKRYPEALAILQQLEKLYPSSQTESYIAALQKIVSGASQ